MLWKKKEQLHKVYTRDSPKSYTRKFKRSIKFKEEIWMLPKAFIQPYNWRWDIKKKLIKHQQQDWKLKGKKERRNCYDRRTSIQGVCKRFYWSNTWKFKRSIKFKEKIWMLPKAAIQPYDWRWWDMKEKLIKHP